MYDTAEHMYVNTEDLQCNMDVECSGTCLIQPPVGQLYWPNWRGGCITEVDSNMLRLFGAMEAGCFREVVA